MGGAVGSRTRYFVQIAGETSLACLENVISDEQTTSRICYDATLGGGLFSAPFGTSGCLP